MAVLRLRIWYLAKILVLPATWQRAGQCMYTCSSHLYHMAGNSRKMGMRYVQMFDL